jgi:hypothetical protein
VKLADLPLLAILTLGAGALYATTAVLIAVHAYRRHHNVGEVVAVLLLWAGEMRGEAG